MVKWRQVSEEKVKCECGYCEILIPRYNNWGRETKYAFGHSKTKHKKENMEIECGCGCGVKILKYDKYWQERKFLPNHHKRKEITKDGEYEYVYSPNHPHTNHRNKVYKHRLVMETHIGRYLTEDEIVHHKDENPHNNDISNLEIMTRSRHKQHHWKKDFTDVYCILCNSKTYINPTTGHQHWTKYKNGYLCMKCYKRMKKEGLL